MKKLDMTNMVFGMVLGRDLEQQERMMTALSASQLPAGNPLGVVFLKPLIDGRVEAEAKIARLNTDLNNVRQQLKSAAEAGEPVAPPQDEAARQDLEHQLAILRGSLTVDLANFGQQQIGLTVALPNIQGVNVSWSVSPAGGLPFDLPQPNGPATTATLSEIPEGSWSAEFVATFSINNVEVIRRAVTISGQKPVDTPPEIRTVTISAPASYQQQVQEATAALTADTARLSAILSSENSNG